MIASKSSVFLAVNALNCYMYYYVMIWVLGSYMNIFKKQKMVELELDRFEIYKKHLSIWLLFPISWVFLIGVLLPFSYVTSCKNNLLHKQVWTKYTIRITHVCLLLLYFCHSWKCAMSGLEKGICMGNLSFELQLWFSLRSRKHYS